ncbi:TetR family transcriptional regulator C-terminal domain-containing protein [Nonomuraea sp. SBT364]|uniref:TetR family transcriptional regulator C-terminal domain-containing protein n=1 Tax=Nonomuraea sp. SBT364 TaxID=1580530 RepID=UPI0007C78D1C|nr:TetR family transcriptional regulator C-terminal domain-containing protein [Nonomuraea sp. SBT364]
MTLLTATLRTLALIEPHQRRDARILAAFTAHATAIPSLAEILRQAHARTRDLLAWLIRYGQRTGEFRDDLDADLEAETLLSLVEGLTSLALLGHRPTVPARGAGQLARAELAHALAFWAARCRAIPGATAPSGILKPDQALAGIPASPTSPESSPADSPGWPTYPAGPPPRPPRALRPTPATCRAFWTS